MGRWSTYTQNVLTGLAAAGTFTIPQQFFDIPGPGQSLVQATLILRGTALDYSMFTRTRWYSGSDVVQDERPLHMRQWMERMTRQSAWPLANAGPGGGGVNTGILPFIFNDQRMESQLLQDQMSFRYGKPVQCQIVLGSPPTAGSIDLALTWSDATSPYFGLRGATPINVATTSANNQPFTWSVTGELLAYGIPWHNAGVSNAIQKVLVIIDGVQLFDGDPQAAVGGEAQEANYLLAGSITDPGSLSMVWKKVTAATPVNAGNAQRNKIKFDVGATAINTEEWGYWSRVPQGTELANA